MKLAPSVRVAEAAVEDAAATEAGAVVEDEVVMAAGVEDAAVTTAIASNRSKGFLGDRGVVVAAPCSCYSCAAARACISACRVFRSLDWTFPFEY